MMKVGFIKDSEMASTVSLALFPYCSDFSLDTHLESKGVFSVINFGGNFYQLDPNIDRPGRQDIN